MGNGLKLLGLSGVEFDGDLHVQIMAPSWIRFTPNEVAANPVVVEAYLGRGAADRMLGKTHA